MARYPKYRTCKPAELRGFIKSRTGVDAPSKASRRELIKLLRHLDRNPAPFRFLDLPPELRNRVYEYTLYKDTKTRSIAHAQLLRACKQIHNEAAGVLNATSVARAALIFYKGNHITEQGNHQAWEICAEGDLSFRYGTWEYELNDEYQSILIGDLCRLRRVENVVLQVTIFDQESKEEWEGPKHFFEALVMVCEKLRYVDVEIEEFRTRKSEGQAQLLEMLEPLIDLKSDATLRLRGLEEKTEKEFWRRAGEA